MRTFFDENTSVYFLFSTLLQAIDLRASGRDIKRQMPLMGRKIFVRLSEVVHFWINETLSPKGCIISIKHKRVLTGRSDELVVGQALRRTEIEHEK